MVLLNKACCCFQLSTSAVLLGWLGAAGYFLVVTGMLMIVPDLLFKGEIWDVVQIVIILVVLLISIINLFGCVCLIVGTMKVTKHVVFQICWIEYKFLFFFLENSTSHIAVADRRNSFYIIFRIHFRCIPNRIHHVH